MKATFDGLEWDIEELPNGSSSADDMTELTYAATAECPNCGSRIFGTAHFLDGQLSLISYDECECEDDLDEWDDDEWDDEDDDFEDDEKQGGIAIDRNLVRDFIEVVQTNQKFNLKTDTDDRL